MNCEECDMSWKMLLGSKEDRDYNEGKHRF